MTVLVRNLGTEAPISLATVTMFDSWHVDSLIDITNCYVFDTMNMFHHLSCTKVTFRLYLILTMFRVSAHGRQRNSSVI